MGSANVDMRTILQVEAIRLQLLAEGASRLEIVRQLAMACLGWPYVFGAWGEECTPANRRRRVRSDYPTIKSKCPALNGRSCSDCKWGEGVRMYDCRGFVAWLIRQAGGDLSGQGATSQYNTASNWVRRGKISEMPDCVCCVFKAKGSKMEHVGMHIGGGVIIHCSSGVQTGRTSDRGWTHYAVPAALYSEEEIPMEIIKPTIRRGSRGPEVVELQEILSMCGYDCGTVDGIFGAKTQAALVDFQREAGLDADGICGPKTWDALAIAEARAPAAPATGPEQTYRVTIEGVTWAQYRRILDICPLAEAEREAMA